jgi:hypothetical protein
MGGGKSGGGGGHLMYPSKDFEKLQQKNANTKIEDPLPDFLTTNLYPLKRF